jgi:hypothetical protein
MALRLLLWCSLFGWAVYKIRSDDNVAAGAQMSMAPDERVLERPLSAAITPVAVTPAAVVPAAALGVMIDPEALSARLEAARKAGIGCGAKGVELRVRVGPEGLQSAVLKGNVGDEAAACLTRAVWERAWPAGPGEMESAVSF